MPLTLRIPHHGETLVLCSSPEHRDKDLAIATRKGVERFGTVLYISARKPYSQVSKDLYFSFVPDGFVFVLDTVTGERHGYKPSGVDHAYTPDSKPSTIWRALEELFEYNDFGMIILDSVDTLAIKSTPLEACMLVHDLSKWATDTHGGVLVSLCPDHVPQKTLARLSHKLRLFVDRVAHGKG